MRDEFEVQQLISRYHEAGNIRDWDAVVATFTPDALWDFPRSGRRFEGQAAIREALIAFTAPLEYVAQVNAPAVIAVSGDEATARSSIRESAKFAGRDEGLEAFGIYDDRLVRTAQGWRFTRRTFELGWLHRVPILTA